MNYPSAPLKNMLESNLFGSERKLYQKQLEKQNQKLTTVLESISDAFITVDANWIITYWNRQAELLLHRKREDVLGRNLWDIYPDAIGSEFYRNYQHTLRNKSSIQFEAYYEGVDAWFELTASPYDSGVSVLFRNITLRKRKELELKTANERYEALSKASSEAIWEWNVGEDQYYWHGENVKKLTGYDNINFSTPFIGLVMEEKQQVIQQFQKTIDEPTKDVWRDEYWFKKACGQYIYVRGKAYITRDDEGRAVKLVGSLTDITEEKTAKDALHASEESYKRLFESAPLPQVIYDPESLQILQVNESAILHYGYPRQEFLSLSALDIRPEEDRKKLKHFVQSNKNTQGLVKSTWTHIKKSGERMMVEVTSTLITYQGQKAVLASINDITQKVELENRIAKLKVLRQRKITEATINGQERERKELAKELHDNINQVLTTTKLYLELAETEEAMRMDLIQRSKGYLSNTINEIRALSKALMPPALADIGLGAALKELVNSYLLTKKFSLHYCYDERFEALAEELQITLFRIAQEQLNNVSKYAEAKNVWLHLEWRKNQIILVIKDDGKGFDTTKKSNGIGLSNMKNRAALYNGKIAITSFPSKGCELKVSIPFMFGSQPAKKAFTIFFVEDSPEDQEIIRRAFDEVSPGHQISFFEDGIMLLEKLKLVPKDQLPHLIVLDYHMPLINGLDLLHLLQAEQRFRNIPKIMFSSAGVEENKKISMTANAVTYIEKGLSINEIKENVRQMLTFID